MGRSPALLGLLYVLLYKIFFHVLEAQQPSLSYVFLILRGGGG